MPKKSVTVFDKPYSAEKQAEGLAVSWAVQTGACLMCEHLQNCESNRNFVFPEDSPCVKRKGEILEQLNGRLKEG